MQNRYLGALYLSLAASIWGGMYVVSKIVLTVVPALPLVWLRYVIALIALFIMGIMGQVSWRIQKKDLPLIIAIGIIGYVISISTQFIGTKLSTAQLGSVITSSTPALMVLFAYPILKEKVTWRKTISVILATLGVLMIIGLGGMDKSFQLGGLILVIAAITWALMSVLVKLIPQHYSPLVITTYAILVAAIVLIPPTLLQLHEINVDLLLEPRIVGGILYLGIVSTALAFYLWNKGLQMLDAGAGGIYFFFQPLVGTLLGWIILGEQVSFSFWLGTLLVIAGVLLVIREQ